MAARTTPQNEKTASFGLDDAIVAILESNDGIEPAGVWPLLTKGYDKHWLAQQMFSCGPQLVNARARVLLHEATRHRSAILDTGEHWSDRRPGVLKEPRWYVSGYGLIWESKLTAEHCEAIAKYRYEQAEAMNLVGNRFAEAARLIRAAGVQTYGELDRGPLAELAAA